MASLFISHSSKDKEFVRQLTDDLKALGHRVWLDEWEIRVGDCIVTKVELGLAGADFVILVLSKHAVESGWVEKEWRTRYWDEIGTRRTIILPVLIEDCEIPLLLKTKKYADFRTNQRAGFAQLVLAIEPVITTSDSALAIKSGEPKHDEVDQVSGLLQKLHAGSTPLSAVLAETLAVARRRGDNDLAAFCEKELAGYDSEAITDVPWRMVQAYVSPNARVNPQYVGFSGNMGAAFDAMAEDHEHFFPKRLTILFPVHQLERKQGNDPTKTLMTIDLQISDFVKDSKNPDAPVLAYLRGDAYQGLLAAIKTELTKRLLKLLPKAS